MKCQLVVKETDSRICNYNTKETPLYDAPKRNILRPMKYQIAVKETDITKYNYTAKEASLYDVPIKNNQ